MKSTDTSTHVSLCGCRRVEVPLTPNATLMLHGHNSVDTTTAAAWCNTAGIVLLQEYRQCYRRNLCVPTLNTIDYTVRQQVSHTMLALGVWAPVLYHQYKLASHMFQVL